MGKDEGTVEGRGGGVVQAMRGGRTGNRSERTGWAGAGGEGRFVWGVGGERALGGRGAG